MAREFRYGRSQQLSHANNRAANLSKFFSIPAKSSFFRFVTANSFALNRFQSNRI
jgi:hypothetical protein